MLIAPAIGDSSHRVHMGVCHILQIFVPLADTGIGDTFLDPSIPVHVVVGVEFDAACLHGDYWVGCLGLSGKYVEIVGIRDIFCALYTATDHILG